MRPSSVPDQDLTVNGRQTRLWALSANECSELKAYRIARIGIDEAKAPYSRVRITPNGSFFLATIQGQGKILLEGRWQSAKQGSLCLAPPRVLNAFYVSPNQSWPFSWIRYEEPSYVRPIVGGASPQRLPSGADQFGRAIEGLRTEWNEFRDPKYIHHWITLIHGLAMRAAQPLHTSSRIGKLWEIIACELGEDWKLPELARRCGVSAEQLRRLCLRELGRTPMEHVTYMRIQRAQELLEATQDKVEAIAQSVGYHSAHVFTRAFVRCVGMTPSSFRSR